MQNLNIKVGDVVRVSFNSVGFTLCNDAEVLYIPVATGDSWIFLDRTNNLTHYVSEGCTITKLYDGGK